MINIELIQVSKAKYTKYITVNKILIKKHKKQKIYCKNIEDFIKYLEINIKHSNMKEAQYDIKDDIICMPFKSRFRKLKALSRKNNYYITLFHELSHWTGHKSRIKRMSLTKYCKFSQTEGYDFELRTLEELTAELCANMLMDLFDLQKIPNKYSLGFLNNELSYFDKDQQEKLYNKANSQAITAFKFLKKRYIQYVKKNRPI